ncbi:MAG: YqgE/AlgH family protein [Alphaproteobacteria bacterium]
MTDHDHRKDPQIDDQTPDSDDDEPKLPPGTSLVGKVLIAMPQMGDPRFERSLIYMCAHSTDGAMGIVINRAMEEIVFSELLPQLGIAHEDVAQEIRVQFGGPVEPSRGFVLHSADVMGTDSMKVTDALALTATLDMLRLIAVGDGPEQHIFALGYAGWAPGQLESEIASNGWLTVTPTDDILFSLPLKERWNAAMSTLGVDPGLLSGSAGHA